MGNEDADPDMTEQGEEQGAAAARIGFGRPTRPVLDVWVPAVYVNVKASELYLDIYQRPAGLRHSSSTSTRRLANVCFVRYSKTATLLARMEGL
jgi:hypothetical protein